MPSQRTLVCVGAAALAVVIAGAGAVMWIHSELPEPNLADIPVVTNAPAEPKPPTAAPPRKRSRSCRQGHEPNRGPRACLRHRKRRSFGRRGHRWPRGAERKSRTPRRWHDCGPGDRRRFGPVCHHPAGAKAGRSQPHLGRKLRQGATCDIEPDCGFGSCARSQDGRRGGPASDESDRGRHRPREPQCRTLCTGNADSRDARGGQRRPRRDPVG